MVKLTEKQQRDLLISLGAADFITKGKITSKSFDAVMALARAGRGLIARAAPPAGGLAGRGLVRLAGTAKTIAMRHPILTAGAIIYVNRDEAAELLREGYDVVQEELPGIRERLIDLGTPQEILEERRRARMPTRPALGGRKKKTKFNRAISVGMKAVKKSRNGGKSGKLTNAKKTFSTVTKTASKILKGRKVSNRGVTGTAARAMRKILKRSR